MKRIDLHMHSTYTDGSCTPTELVEKAKELSLAAIAITDHDNISAYNEAAPVAKRLGIELLPGIEMSTKYKGRRLHILGFGMNFENPDFLKAYQKARKPKEDCVDVIVERLQKRGIAIDREKIMPYSNGFVDRYAVMRFFAAHKKQDDVQYIWDDYINPATKDLAVNTPTEEAIRMIRAAGGVASLAHYHKKIGLGGLEEEEKISWLGELKEMGLNAMEALYSSFSPEDEAFAAQMVRRFAFLPTGGTDFHGENRPGYQLGIGRGDLEIPYGWYEGICSFCHTGQQ